LAAWQLRVPQIRSDWDDLARTFPQSVSDLASLRMRGGGRAGRLPAAGMPWFMTVFGRDTIITCLQTLLFGPELARTALEGLAELAREIWRDRPLAERLEREAQERHRAFNERFWTDARGGYYVLALDGEKRQVDSLCSNVGHLLWSGIVPTERLDAVVDALMGQDLWSGWGVRTMSAGDAGYNPLSYHNGTVWPHDNSLIA